MIAETIYNARPNTAGEAILELDRTKHHTVAHKQTDACAARKQQLNLRKSTTKHRRIDILPPTELNAVNLLLTHLIVEACPLLLI